MHFIQSKVVLDDLICRPHSSEVQSHSLQHIITISLNKPIHDLQSFVMVFPVQITYDFCVFANSLENIFGLGRPYKV